MNGCLNMNFNMIKPTPVCIAKDSYIKKTHTNNTMNLIMQTAKTLPADVLKML